jgi:hypothetical protein
MINNKAVEFYLKNAEERFIRNEKYILHNKEAVFPTETVFFDIFEWLQNEKIVAFLHRKTKIGKEDIEAIFYEINYTFLIFLDGNAVKNPLIQRISIELFKCMMFCNFSKDRRVVVNNRIIQELAVLNSWEEKSDLLFKRDGNNISLFYKEINLSEWLTVVFSDKELMGLLSSEFNETEVRMTFDFLLEALTMAAVEREEKGITDKDIKEVKEALEFYLLADYWDSSLNEMNKPDKLTITPTKNVIDLDKYSADLPQSQKDNFDVEKIYESSFIITQFIIRFCFLNHEAIPSIFNYFKEDEKSKKVLMIALIFHDIFNYNERMEFYRLRNELPSGLWLSYFDDIEDK